METSKEGKNTLSNLMEEEKAGDATEKQTVETFATAAIVSDSFAVPPSDKTWRLSFAPRRCVSKELLEQMSTLARNPRYNEVTLPKPFGCFCLMHLVEKSIQVGAFFSPKLFVPRDIWHQDRVKLAGLSLKVEVFHRLKQGLEKISHALPLASDTGKSAFLNELDALLDFTRHERMQLIRSFPFLPQDQYTAAVPLMRRGSSNGGEKAEESSADTYASGIGKLTNLAFGFGRMVKKQAMAAVERVGAAPSVVVSIDELDEYAAVLCMFFNSTRSIENLLGLRADADGTQKPINDPNKAATQHSQLDSAIVKKLEHLAIFLDEVVIELVMRDVHSLLEIYLRRLTRQFGEFTVEQAVLKRRSSVSA